MIKDKQSFSLNKQSLRPLGLKLKDVILLTLEKAVDGAVVFADFYDNPRRFVWYGPYEYPKSTLSAALARLRKKELIEKTIDEGKVILKLTEAGNDWLLMHKDESLVKWDGIFRMVIFDIPESHKSVREVLRKKLKEWRFVKWQKSVWVSKKPLTEKIRNLVRELGVGDWVLVVESNNTGK